jgi:hypothetical protein
LGVKSTRVFAFDGVNANLGAWGDTMSASIDEAKLKELLKSALVEVLEERRELVKEIFEEAIEEIALTRAIKEGLAT